MTASRVDRPEKPKQSSFMVCIRPSDRSAVNFVKSEISFFKVLFRNHHIHDSPALCQALHMYQISNTLIFGGSVIIISILQTRQLTLRKIE